jgi:ubiquitin carboxyl-terminal hydrolase L5
LEDLKAFSMGLPFKERGLTFGNSDSIRNTHNSFARNDPFIIEES